MIGHSQKRKYELCYFNKGRESRKVPNHLIEIFEDEKLAGKIKKRLPYLFQLAEFESSGAGKICQGFKDFFKEGDMKDDH